MKCHFFKTRAIKITNINYTTYLFPKLCYICSYCNVTKPLNKTFNRNMRTFYIPIIKKSLLLTNL